MDFEENEEEYSNKQGKRIPVIQTNKYKQAKAKAIELIKDKQYGLTTADFWKLMNESKDGKMYYTSLIISHNGCLKINDSLADKFKPESVEIIQIGYNDELVFKYCNSEQGIFEVGEVSSKNCKNEYPYAMALKRCFDRVVLKLSKLAFDGILSDSEAEDEKQVIDENEVKNEKISETKVNALERAIKKYKMSKEIVDIILSNYEYKELKDIEEKNYMNIVNDLSINK